MYKKEIVSAFVEPAQSVWEKELGHTLKAQAVENAAQTFTTEDITAVISFQGQVTGTVLYGFSRITARTIVSTMLGQEVPDLDDVANSALSELAMMMTVRATAELSAAGYECQFSVPVVVDVPGTILNISSSQMKMGFSSDLGLLNIRIALADNAHDDEDSLDWLWSRWR